MRCSLPFLLATSLCFATGVRADVLGRLTITDPGGGNVSGGIPYDFTKFDAGVYVSVVVALPVVRIVGPLFRGRPFQATDIGVAVDTVTPQSDANFVAFAQELTDGQRDVIGSYFTVYTVMSGSSSSQYHASSSVTDFNLIGAPTPNLDLVGHEITSITRTVELLNITPINGGLGYAFSGTRISIVIEGRVPEPSCALSLIAAPLLLHRRRSSKAN